MPPDLNSLPSSRSMAGSPVQPRAMQTALLSSDPDRQASPSPRPRRSSTSLAATASINAADISMSRRSSASNRGSPRLGRNPSEQRHRTQIAMNLSLNDPTIPSPGELSSSDHRRNSQSYMSISPSTIGGRTTIATGDPHHQRQPSLGEIHNELEQEQEAQVNRMLHLIRDQQLQLDSLRNSQQSSSTHPSHPSSAAAVVDDLTPASETSASFPSAHPAIPAGHTQPPRRISRPPSATTNRSPALRPIMHTHESSLDSVSSSPLEAVRRNSTRDESIYYQAETAALTRENQLLRQRIRELERQVSEMNAAPANTPATPSNLTMSASAAEEEASRAAAIRQLSTPGGEKM